MDTERGPQGDPGAGERGARGPQGEPGIKAPAAVVRAFWTVVIVAFVVTCFATYEAFQARKAARSNTELIRRVDAQSATIGQLKVAQIASCKNFSVLKDAVNDFHGTIRKVLEQAVRTDLTRARNINNPTLRRADLQSAHSLQRILGKTHTVRASCAQRPILKHLR